MKCPVAFVILCDGVRGQYAWQHALNLHKENLVVYAGQGKDAVPVTEWIAGHQDILPGETLQTVLDPDNEEFDVNVSILTYENTLMFRMNGRDDDLWAVEMLDGDVGAVNPAAVWCDQEEIYTLPRVAEAA